MPAKGRLVLWLLALGVPLLLLVAWWPSGKPKSRPTLPNPNGYDYFVKAGGALTGIWTNRMLSTVPLPDLQAYVAANQASLELAHEGLKYGSLSHFNPAYHAATKTYHFGDALLPLKRLGYLMSGQGRLAELEGDLAAAVDGYTTAMRYAQEACRGGVTVERWELMRVEQVSLTELRRLLPLSEAANVRRSLIGLQKLDASHEQPSVNIESEEAWISQAFPVWRRVMLQFHPTSRSGLRQHRHNLVNDVNALQVDRRRAIVEAAARLFELEKGRRPTGYADLVPAYLPAAPLDPTTGKEIAHPF
ncbi:MAG: Uncharacterized protein FD161_2140 [Limisphaerales bacterium]|nr:MAG: Uncharacterized protein FD161_2140 [Limisphaerales bacterium]KAG0508846.1 MAG: Uncharacterized protein E1N63_1942 [Limisphaerales bacterium]TXT49694.1 MAG: Uncharacterized protein FD140_2848 [Limisphaerales bacterium]